jgi:hypothetical protein
VNLGARLGLGARPLVGTLAALALLGVTVAAAPASAQMDLALSRLRVPTGTDPCGADPARQYCADNTAWRRLATDFAGSLIPPLLTPARTRGPRAFYVGVEMFITPIVPTADHWVFGTEGAGTGGTSGENRFVDAALLWTRLELRKALPFGFELGTSVGFLPSSSYWTLGLEIRWAVLEGWLSDDWWVPDLAVRGAVQTLVGDPEFNTTVASVDVTLSNSVIVGDELELSPYLAGQLAWTFMDTELVDLTPNRNAFEECNPTPGDTVPSCRGTTGDDYNNNVVFDSIRTMRARMIFGLQARYEVFTLTGAFSFDLVPPGELDASLPPGIDRQMQIDVAAGLSF